MLILRQLLRVEAAPRSRKLIIGRWHGRFVHLPMPLATRKRKQVDPQEELWLSVVEATGVGERRETRESERGRLTA